MKKLFKKREKEEIENIPFDEEYEINEDDEWDEDDEYAFELEIYNKAWKEKTFKEKIITIKVMINNFLDLIGRIIGFTLLGVCVLVVLFVGYIHTFISPIVDEYESLANSIFEVTPPKNIIYLTDTVIYDKEGDKISEINIGNYEYIKIKDIPQWIQQGHIAIEDKKFRIHNGINISYLFDNFLDFFNKDVEITSTITQKVIRTNLLEDKNDFKYKLVEVLLSPKFEKTFRKQKVMELYLNTNYYGNNCYGIETASFYYFGKETKVLSLAESAFLVAIGEDSEIYNPENNFVMVKAHQEEILDEMYNEKFISKEECESAKLEELNLVYRRGQRTKENYQTSYALHCATLILMEEAGFEFRYTFEDEIEYELYQIEYNEKYTEISTLLRLGGYSIYTSLDTSLQKKLQYMSDSLLKEYTEKTSDGIYKFQTASVIINNETGFVEAIVGGRGEEEYNRAFEMYRQPGSIIKPLVVYAPAFNTGMYYPSYIVNDVEDEISLKGITNIYDSYLGEISVREAIARDTNTVSYSILKDISVNSGVNYLGQMKFMGLSHSDNYNSLISVGEFTKGATVVEITKGYSTLVNNGEYIDNTCILKIEKQNSGVIYECKSDKTVVYDSGAAYMTLDSCRDVLSADYGTAKYRQLVGQDAMAKTGKSLNSTDIWFCGSTVYYSMGVWVGYDSPEDIKSVSQNLPGTIWGRIMFDLHKNLEYVEFSKPDSVVELNIDSTGEITEKNTGKTDIFSKSLLEKAEDERLYLVEVKKLEEDNIKIQEIKNELDALTSYVIKDINGLYYLKDTFSKILDEINTVYQADKKEELRSKYLDVYAYFEEDIIRMEKQIDREEEKKRLEEEKKRKEEEKKRIEQEYYKEKEIVDDLNNFNTYLVTSSSDESYINSQYIVIREKILDLYDTTKHLTYLDLLDRVKEYHMSILWQYKEQDMEAEKEVSSEDRVNILASLDANIKFLRELKSYYLGIETLFDSFETEMDEAEKKGIDVSKYREEFQEIKNRIYRINP